MNSSDPPYWPAWIVAVLAVAGGIVRFFKRFFSFVTREEFERELEAKHTENKASIKESKETLDRIEAKIDAGQLDVLASRLGRTERDVQDLRDWKHSVDPFIHRRVER